MDEYRHIADTVEADIRAGLMSPGDRLPTQRAFARAHGIATSTASRVYGELVRRGLVVGEVGRGTFVRASPPPVAALAEPAPGGVVDLELSVPAVPGQYEPMAHALVRLLRPDVLAGALGPVGTTGTPRLRAAAVEALARGGWAPEPGGLLFTGSGRQAIAAALSAVVPRGGRLGVERLTYPTVQGVAAHLGLRLVPVDVDDDGIDVHDLERVHHEARLDAVYVQPTLHNPTSATLPRERRMRLAGFARRHDVVVVEDSVRAHLAPPDAAHPPVAAYAPEATVLVDSLSKRLAPGLTAGFVSAPARLVERVAGAVRSGPWGAQRFALEAMASWVQDGTLEAVTAAKRADARERESLVARHLAAWKVGNAPGAYFAWWRLPEPWRADTFTAAAARQGIAVTPGAAFAVPPTAAGAYVRLGLASPPPAVLDGALAVLAEIARSSPQEEFGRYVD